MKTDKVVKRYYMRQQIEQVFDLGKNNCKLTPVRIHSEDTLRGHLMMTFLAAVVGKKIQQEHEPLRLAPDAPQPEVQGLRFGGHPMGGDEAGEGRARPLQAEGPGGNRQIGAMLLEQGGGNYR